MVETGQPAASCIADSGRGERRASGIDRRCRALWQSLFYGSLTPRRRTGRRAADRHSPIIDWHGPWLFLSSTLVLILCVVDAFMTLRLLENGAVEANPFMALYVYDDGRRFAIIKLALTGAGVLTLVSLARFPLFRVLRAAVLVHVVLAAYLLLVCYEWMLLQHTL